MTLLQCRLTSYEIGRETDAPSTGNKYCHGQQRALLPPDIKHWRYQPSVVSPPSPASG